MRTRVLAALPLVTLAVAGCASAPAPSPEPPSSCGGYASLGLADIPAAPPVARAKTLDESSSRGIVSLAQFAEFAAALVHETR